MEQFPELGHQLEQASLVDFVMELEVLFDRALESSDVAMGRRIILLALWMDKHSRASEQFVYFVESLFKPVMTSKKRHGLFYAIATPEHFAQLHGVFAMFLEPKALSEFEREYRFSPRASTSPH